jgi:hypothetical protein
MGLFLAWHRRKLRTLVKSTVKWRRVKVFFGFHFWGFQTFKGKRMSEEAASCC